MIRFHCECGEQLKARDDQAGRKIRCSACEAVVRVPEAEDAAEEARPDTGIRKSKPRSMSARDVDDERPARRRRAEDSDDRPRRRRNAEQGSNAALIGVIVAGAVLLLAGGGLGLFFLLRSAPDDVLVDRQAPPMAGKTRIVHAAARQSLQNNMKQITLAMHNFNDFYRRWPQQGFAGDPKLPATKPLLSWRVAMLPFVEEDNLYKQFKLDEPWDSPHNRTLLPLIPRVFQPVSPQPSPPAGQTYLQLVTGPGTLYPDSSAAPSMPRSFPDGTSNTIVLVEAAEAVPWTKPADLQVDVRNVDQGLVPKLGAFAADGFFVGLGDGSVRFVERNRVSDRTIRQAFNPNDGMPLGADW